MRHYIREVMRNIATAYVSDSRWPPAPTSPGRFNVIEAIDALKRANNNMVILMQAHRLTEKRSLFSPAIMQSNILAVEDELMAIKYFGET